MLPGMLTPEQYLEIERRTQHRSEYVDGQMYAMSGASLGHNQISLNAWRALVDQVDARGCTVCAIDMKVAICRKSSYLYPDVVVICGAPEFHDERTDIVLNPKVVIEVLSPSTQTYDRGQKFELYREIPSLAEYLLISQDRVHVEHYVRQPIGHWEYSEMKDPDGAIELPSIGATLKSTDVYHRVKFA